MTLEELQEEHRFREELYMGVIADHPLPRTPVVQAYVDMFLDALQKASRELRNAKRQAFYARQDEVREEVRRDFPCAFDGRCWGCESGASEFGSHYCAGCQAYREHRA